MSSCLEAQRACRVEDIVTGQVASAQLPQARKGLSSVQDTPVVNKENLVG